MARGAMSRVGTGTVAIWRLLPIAVRALIVAFVVLNVGSTLTALPLIGNTRVFTSVPWALSATLLILWPFWWYASGKGYPAATRAYRERMTRAKHLGAPVWRASLLAVVLALIASWSLRLVLPSIVPVEAPHMAISVRAYPVATVIGLMLALAVSAGIVEEIAFRGYLQKSLEELYGIVPALIITGVAFWLAHADKVTVSHLPFHLAVSILLGTATYLTRSLLPAIIAHALGDALLLPVYVYHYPGAVWQLLTARPVWEAHGSGVAEQLGTILAAVQPALLLEPGSHPLALTAWILIASSVGVVWALRRLARVAAPAGKC